MLEQSNIDIREIIRKTGHNLEEIRLRALENILSKLRNGIICNEDLIHHKELFVNLLQWFNHENPPKIGQVLKLLESLSKHGAAVSTLQSLGGVQFFSTLRQDLSDKEHLELIDSLLDSIFWVHMEEEQQCLHIEEMTQGSVGYSESKKLEKSNHKKENTIERSQSSQDAIITNSKKSLKKSPTTRSMLSQEDVKPSLNHVSPEIMVMQDVISNDVKENDTRGHTALAAEWVVLTASDRHILSVTESRLQSHSMDLVWQSCEFFRDVLLQDFPTYIFIQRPNIVKILLHLLDINSQKEEEIIPMLIGCLNDLTVKLAKSSLQQMTPDLSEFSKLKESYSSTASSVHTELSSLHSRTTSFNGEGTSVHSGNAFERDFQSNVGSDPEDFEGEILTEALQQSQWSAVDYCLNVTSSVISFIKQAIESGNRCEESLMLLNKVLGLLCIHDVKSCWNSDIGERKVYDVMACLRHFSGLVQLCIDAKNNIISQPWNSIAVERIFALLGNVLRISIRFLLITVPYDKVYEALPESLVSSYKVVFADEILAQIYPSIRASLHGIMKAVEEEFYNNFQQANNVVLSMKMVMTFLKESGDKEASSSKILLKRLNLCEASVQSAGFHKYQPLIQTSLNLISHIFSVTNPTADLTSKGKDILMHLLSHEKDQVRLLTYEKCLDIVTDALSESHVTNPLSCSYQRALFLINSDVLQEMVSFGVESPNKKIANFAVNILVTLLLGRLNMSSKTWQALVFSLIPALPLLQCFAGIDKALGRALTSLSDSSNALLASDGEMYSLPPLEQLRASFRFMFVKDDSIRAKGFASLVWTLSQEDNKAGHPVRYPHETIQNASDMFLVPPTMSCKYQSDPTEHTSFSGAKLDQLWDVFDSSTVDQSLRESAAEQLSVLVQDINLHKQLLARDADKVVAKELGLIAKQLNFYTSASVGKDLKMILSCITILRYLLQYDTTRRHTSSVNRDLLLDILRCRMAYHDNEMIHFETSCLIMFLVFDEMFRKNANEITIPSLIAKRYTLPLRFKLHDMTTVYREKSKNAWNDHFLALEGEPLHSMIRISWNVILTAEIPAMDDVKATSNQALVLTSTEIKLLQELRQNAAVDRHLITLTNSDHAAVLITAMKDLDKHWTSCMCKLFKREVVGNFINYIQHHDVLKRILTIIAVKNKATFLESLNGLCQMLSFLEADERSSLSKYILTTLLEAKGPLSAAVSNYTTIRAQQPDLPRAETEAYDLTNESRSLFKSILSLISSLCMKINSDDDVIDYKEFNGIGDFIFIILQTLNRVDSTRFYDLPVLESTLDCLSHLTYKRGWSLQYAGNGEALCNVMANIFVQILYSFHVDRIGASTSFMGKGVIAKAALGLCHVAMENQAYCGSKDWTVNWVSRNLHQPNEEGMANDLPWLLPLLTDRILDIRWCGWSLCTALLNGIVGAESVVNEFQVFPGGVWASAVGVILDVFENPLVRTQTCRLLSMSLSKLKASVKRSSDHNLWESMVVQDTQTQENISGVPAFLLLLDHFHFLNKIKEQLMLKPTGTVNNHLTTLHQNVSTSCSTMVSDTEHIYENISGDSNDVISTAGSFSVADSKAGSDRGSVLGRGSSSERLLLSSADSLDTDDSQLQQAFYRVTSLERARKADNELTTTYQQPTRKLKAAIFQLILKLVEIDAESVIMSLETESFFDVLIRSLEPEIILSHVTKPTDKLPSGNVNAFIESAEMNTNLIRLINVISFHQKTYVKLDDDPNLPSNLISLFRLPNDFVCGSVLMNDAICNLWKEALLLLISMCNGKQSLTRSKIEDTVFNNFDSIVVSFVYVGSLKRKAESTSCLFLSLFKTIFCREGRRPMPEKTFWRILDSPCATLSVYKRNPNATSADAGCPLTLGEYLGTLLMDQLGTFHVTSPGRKDVVASLSTLFVVCNSSKIIAVENGFIESLMEDIKDIHVKLNLASLEISKADVHSKKEKLLLSELANTLDLARNMAHSNTTVKAAAVQSGLLMSIQKIWSWCMVDKPLKLSVLEFLSTITSNCNKAQEFVCHGEASSNRTTHEENSLFQSFIKLLIRLHKDTMAPTGKIENSLKVAFHLITNLAVLSDCRSLLWKCNFLQNFKSCLVGQSANKKQKIASKILTALWIQFLLVLSFFADGTNAILKNDSMLSTLIAFASEDNHRERQRSMLILRNLLFFPANKPSLVTNGQLITCLLKGLDTKSIWTKSIIVSCFASLLHNCHKAKVTLKKTRLSAKLELLHEEILSGKTLCNDGQTKGYDLLKSSLKKTLDSLTK